MITLWLSIYYQYTDVLMLTVSLIQTDLYWENPEANRAMLEEKISTIEQATDLIVLPEMFTTGFTMNPKGVAEAMGLTTFRWMKQQAAQANAVVTGSYVVRDGGNFYNRLVWMQPDGEFDVYDKRHLFRMANEHHFYQAGTKRLVKSWRGWNICPLVCYDLRFPVWSGMWALNLICCCTSPIGPPPVVMPGMFCCKRAPLRIYVTWLASTRVGTDGDGKAYAGDGNVIDFKGESICYQQNSEVIHTISLQKTELSTFRERFPAHLDADRFSLDGL